MRKIVWLLGTVCIFSSVLLISCKPPMQPGEVSSDAFTASMMAGVRPIDDLKVAAKVQGGSDVKISWSQVSRARSYVLSRSEGESDRNWKVLDTLDPEMTSYVDGTAKTGVEYHYTVEAYCEYNETDRFAYETDQMPESLSAECFIYTGVGEAHWSETLSREEQIKPGAIKLEYSFGAKDPGGVEPEGVEIYRGTSKGNCALLERGTVAEHSTREYDFGKNYIDKRVEQGKTYYYQVRAYAIFNGKRVYGKKSKPLKLTAAEPEGRYSVRVSREPSTYSKNIIVALTSSTRGNGTLTLSAAAMRDQVTYLYRLTETAYASSQSQASPLPSGESASALPPYQAVGMTVSRISSDGHYFSSLEQDIVLEPQKTIYLELTPEDRAQQLWTSQSLSVAKLSLPAKYNEGKHTMQMDLKSGKAVLADLSSGGEFISWSETTKQGSRSSLRLVLVSSLSANKKLTLLPEALESVSYAYQLKNEDALQSMSLRVEKYSTDGVKWKAFSKKGITLEKYGMLYLKLVPVEQGAAIPYRLKGQRHADLTLDGTYPGVEAWSLHINLLKNTAETISGSR